MDGTGTHHACTLSAWLDPQGPLPCSELLLYCTGRVRVAKSISSIKTSNLEASIPQQRLGFVAAALGWAGDS